MNIESFSIKTIGRKEKQLSLILVRLCYILLLNLRTIYQRIYSSNICVEREIIKFQPRGTMLHSSC